MSCSLYTKALALLNAAQRAAWEAFDQWLRRWDPHGVRLAENIQLESHLLGDRLFGNAEELASFMNSCSERFENSSTEDARIEAFCATCKEHMQRGMRIYSAALPPTLVRYASQHALVIALERMVGTAGLIQLERDQISYEEAAQLVKVNWDLSRFTADDRVAAPDLKFAYATFETGTISPNADAQYIAECLALPCAVPGGIGKKRKKLLTRLQYPSANVQNHRFPTIAEAEIFPYFQPAPECEPDPSQLNTCVGWTKSIGEGPNQPELIHDNASLGILIGPIAFVGTFER